MLRLISILSAISICATISIAQPVQTAEHLLGSGLSIRGGLGHLAIRDHYISEEKYSGSLIFDVRNNGGGHGEIAHFIASRFATAPITYVWYSPGGAPRWTYTITPAGAYRYQKPVVVLINGASFSSAELLPELMQQNPLVTTVGDTTGGGGGSNDVFFLPSNKRIRIPTSYFRRFDGEMVEWNGVPPDILVPQTEADVKQGRDKQLERAITLLK